MLGILLGTFTLTTALCDVVFPHVKAAQEMEELKQQGLFDVAERIKDPDIPAIEIGGTDLTLLPIRKGEPLSYVFGQRDLIVTFYELEWLCQVEDFKSTQTLGHLKWILVQQLIRSAA